MENIGLFCLHWNQKKLSENTGTPDNSGLNITIAPGDKQAAPNKVDVKEVMFLHLVISCFAPNTLH